MKKLLRALFVHTYALEITVKVISNDENAMDVTAGDLWAAILSEPDLSIDELMTKALSPTHTEQMGLKLVK